MASNKQNTLFGLHDFHVKLPSDTSSGWVQLVGVEDAAFKGEVSEVEQLGDDQRLGVFYHTQKGTVTAKASLVTVAVLEKLSGTAAQISVAGTGPANSTQSVDVTDIMNLNELTPPFVAVRCSVTAQRADGTSGRAYMYFYKCRCKTVWESAAGGSYGKLMEPSLNIETFLSTNDEMNVALAGGKTVMGRVEWA